MHCATHSFGVIETVRGILKSEEDIVRFQDFLQTVSNRKELCRVDEVFEECKRIQCVHCFRRVWQSLSELIGKDAKDDEGVATNLLGEDPLKTVAECTTHEHPNVTQQPGFLPSVYDRIEMLPSFVPIGPRYTLEMFIKNLKVLLDRTDGLRADGKDLDVLETVIDEQNQVLGMLADCTAEFITAVYKFEYVRPFKEVHTLVYAFVALFEVLCKTLFDACHKVRERFHRTNVPSVVGVNMPMYLERYKADVPEITYKGVLVSLHILNIQRLSAFQTFYTLACDQMVVLEHEYVREVTNKFKYMDQMDFALPYKDMSIKIVLLAHLEMALGPLNGRTSSVEYAHGRYPSVTQELGMLELRCSKIQEGHLDVWTRTKDRAVHQLIPEDFPMTPSFRADIDAVVKRCQKNISASEFAKETMKSAPQIDAILHTDPLGAMRQRMVLRSSGLRALTDLAFSTLKVTGLVAFLHDYFPVLQEYVCGTDQHVQLFVRGMLINAHVRMLFVEFDKYDRERAMREIMELTCVQTAPQKSTAPKQKKMSEKSARKKKSEPVAATASQPATTVVQTSSLTTTVHLPSSTTATDSDGEWEQVQTKKKSSTQQVKVTKPGTYFLNHARTRTGRSTQTKKNPHAPPSKKNSAHIPFSPTVPTTTTDAARRRDDHDRTDAARRRDDHDRVRMEPEPVREPEPEPVREPEPEPAREPEPEPADPVIVPIDLGPEPVPATIEPPTETPTETPTDFVESDPVKPKSERRRGKRNNHTSQPPPPPAMTLFVQPQQQIDPLVLASYAASQVSEPIHFVRHQTVAVPARMFGGTLSPDYASVPFMTFPRVYI